MSVATTFVLMVLAAYRIYRLIGMDSITERPRAWILKRIDSDKLQEFVTCPWCCGFWVSVAVVAITAQATTVPLPALQAAAVSCVVGLIGGNLDG